MGCLLIDSTSLKFLREGAWMCMKYQPEYRRQLRKLHKVIDAQLCKYEQCNSRKIMAVIQSNWWFILSNSRRRTN